MEISLFSLFQCHSYKNKAFITFTIIIADLFHLIVYGHFSYSTIVHSLIKI